MMFVRNQRPPFKEFCVRLRETPVEKFENLFADIHYAYHVDKFLSDHEYLRLLESMTQILSERTAEL